MMKMRSGRLKAAVAVLMTAVMALGLCACGGRGGSDGGNRGGLGGQKGVSSDPALAKQYVYRMEEFGLSAAQGEGDDTYIQDVMQYDGRLYLLLQTYNWEKYANAVQKMMSMNLDGTDVKIFELDTAVGGAKVTDQAIDEAADASSADEMSEDDDMEWDEVYEYVSFGNFRLTNAGRIFGIKDYVYEDYTDQENYINIRNNYVCCWDLEGRMLWETPVENLQTDESWSYINGILGLQDGSAVLLITGDKNGKITVDAQGTLSPLQPLSTELSDLMNRMINWYVSADGTALLTFYDENWDDMYIVSYDINTDTLGEKSMLPNFIAYSGGAMMPEAGGNMLYTTQQGVYRYRSGDTEPNQIMSFINSDLDIRGLDFILPVDEEHFIGFYSQYDEMTWVSTIAGGVFTRVDPKDIPDKKVLVLAGNYIPSDIRKRAVEFNKTSQTHRIVLKDYSEYQTYDDYYAGITRMNNEIISGDMPDILIVESDSMPVENYISKGLLADIGKLIEEDKELSKADFLENVFEAFKVNGKLYEIIPSFCVDTYIGKTSLVGGKEGWTMEEAKQFAATMPEGTSLFGDMSNVVFLSAMLEQCGSDFVDISTGKCNFDSPEFISLLEYAGTLPKSEEIYGDGGMFDDTWYADYVSQYRENRTILYNFYISGNFEDAVYTINGSFGEDVSFVGFPGSGSQRAVVSASTTYVLSAKSANLDAAWDFMRYYLTEEYQNELDWQMPVLRKKFEENVDKAMQKPYYEDENGKKVEYDYTYWMNDEEIILDPLTREQTDRIKNFITSVTRRSYSNISIQNIIEEEAEAFFSGQKSAEDVAKIIQSRVQIFVNENR